MKATSTLIGFIGLLATLTGIIFINTSNYGLPPHNWYVGDSFNMGGADN